MQIFKTITLTSIAGAVITLTPLYGQSNTSVSSEGTVDSQYELDMALQADGAPAIVYHDSITNSQSLAICSKTTCKGQTQILPTGASGGYSSSIVMDSGNMPLYTESDPGWIRSCFLGSCTLSTGFNTQIVGGSLPVLATDASGQNVFMAYSEANGGVGLYHCTWAMCQQTFVNSLVVPNDVPIDIDLEVDQNGLPVIAYLEATQGDLRVVHCDDPDCVEEVPSTVVNAPGVLSLSLGVGSDVSPIISYVESSHVTVVHCNDPLCANNDESPVVVDSSTTAGPYDSLTVDSVGYPVITYQSATDSSLLFVHCNDAGCAGNDESIISVGRRVTAGRSVIKLAGGNPVIGYMDTVDGELHVISCRYPDCSH